eukprot:8836209-Alexandrium_andersonii.AAC.1
MGAILSAKMLLRSSLGLREVAPQVAPSEPARPWRGACLWTALEGTQGASVKESFPSPHGEC